MERPKKSKIKSASSEKTLILRLVFFDGLLKLLTLGILALTWIWPGQVAAQTGREVALKWDAVDNSQSSSYLATFTIRRSSRVLLRTMEIIRQKTPDAEKQLIAFQEPPDVRGTAYLTWAYKDPKKDDDMWVFLPAESLTRRIAGGARKGPFMRSDYALEDISRREVDEDNWELIRREKVFGTDCFLLSAVPLAGKKGVYAKRLAWVREDIFLPTKVEYYGEKDKLIKTLILGDFQNIQGIWLPLKQEMRAKDADSATTLELTRVVFNQPVAADLFWSENLKR
ncbi:MAG: outer membrane lipoprotein-sorting protein [Deltaproteobacteria bacterium]|jgi:hypothetical protein|nr:outer membrane lipoprotein-sorting protein [Deltaproteobacteria bacterium]